MLEIRHSRMVLLLGFLLCLTRPEGALFALGAVLLLDRKTALYLIFLLTGYAIWKLFYYGDLLPNTFYAKGTENRFHQGILYVVLFFSIYWPLVPIFALTTWDVYQNKTDPFYRYVAACLLILLIHVIRVGGDFMFARFLLPIVPFLLLIAHRRILCFYSLEPKKQHLLSVLIMCCLFLCRPTDDLKKI